MCLVGVSRGPGPHVKRHLLGLERLGILLQRNIFSAESWKERDRKTVRGGMWESSRALGERSRKRMCRGPEGRGLAPWEDILLHPLSLHEVSALSGLPHIISYLRTKIVLLHFLFCLLSILNTQPSARNIVNHNEFLLDEWINEHDNTHAIG